MRAIVVALGDLGRSPRSVLHAAALARAGIQVDLVGFSGTAPWLLGGAAGVVIHPLRERGARAGAAAGVVLRGMGLAWELSRALARLPRADVMLVQTPPAIPTLAVAALVARLRRTRLVFDWHNQGAPLLAQKLGERHALTRFYAWGERTAGRFAGRHLCVTHALRERLLPFGVEATVFADRPAAVFERFGGGPRSRRRLTAASLCDVRDDELLAVAPTSFTRDEDLALLTAACDELETRLRSSSARGRLLVLVTGRGASRERLGREWLGQAWQRVRIRTAWLEAEDYPRLLGAADLGLSLHRSASGADFPMKFLDMRGAGLPVCALRFDALAEGFAEGRDGWGFRNAGELADRLERMVADPRPLDGLRATGPARESWEAAWQREAAPVILG
jgi:beta-1,4-mannosyltransferase